MAAYAKLTEAERERLEMLAEEASEIVQAVTKILRYGYENYHPEDRDRTSNRLRLAKDLWELEAIIGQMRFSGDLGDPLREIWKKKLQYTHHQQQRVTPRVP